MAYTTVNKSSLHHGNISYDGTGSTNAKTGFGFAPDFVLGKVRNHTYDWNVYDKVRGATKLIRPNQTNAENTESTSVTSFDSDGYTLGAYAGMNESGRPYTNGAWKAGTTSSITTGGATITPSSYSFNSTAKFSIIAYTGTGSAATIPHGLGVAPEMIWVKRLDSTTGWTIYFEVEGAGNYLRFTTGNVTSDTNIWNNTSPTTNLFSVGTDADVNGSGNTYIAYCFAPVRGYCHIGKYEGNSNADGAYVYCGFRPQTIMIKERASSKNWYYFNDKRLGYNPNNRPQKPSQTEAEITNVNDKHLDIYSNGFKLRDSDNEVNASGNIYNFVAWGQSIVGTNNIPNTAR
tara:strand:+ start:834 stop:1871 length:1038 start_codon:yes stop_codon:yes gene_type:complete